MRRSAAVICDQYDLYSACAVKQSYHYCVITVRKGEKASGLKGRDVGNEDLPDRCLTRLGVASPDSDRPNDAAVLQGSDHEIIRQ